MKSIALAQDLTVAGPYSLRDTMHVLQMGTNDPTMLLKQDRVVFAQHTPDGLVTVEVTQLPAPESTLLKIRCWGAGAAWILERLPSLLGFEDDPLSFQPTGRLRRLHYQHIGMRMVRLPMVSTRVLQVVLMQLVSWRDAFGSWRRFVERFGDQAPGPHDLRSAPRLSAIRQIPHFELIECGIIPKLARTLHNVAAAERHLETAATTSPAAFATRMQRIHGVGEWTTQYVLGTALGQADALLTGDYNMPHTVAWFFAGQDRADDEQMTELLEPFRGHRFRVVRLLWISGVHAPRHGPRAGSVRQRMFGRRNR